MAANGREPQSVARKLMGALGSEPTAGQLADIDLLVEHLASTFTPGQARLWLEGQNPLLGGRPIDVFRLRGAAPVIAAVRAHQQGAFA
ncbi:hypothetical protein [Sinomonas sp. RB5]